MLTSDEKYFMEDRTMTIETFIQEELKKLDAVRHQLNHAANYHQAHPGDPDCIRKAVAELYEQIAGLITVRRELRRKPYRR